uniref:SS18 N-terminal domain-containing protein n=1 Tax=Arion vulgaris TaxID=1028688 RepID=A0A0B6ZDW1_9EUPU
MSLIFVPPNQKPTSNVPDIHETIEKMLEENAQLLHTINEYQMRGKMTECVEYQKVLHRNIVYLAKLADSNINTSLPLQTPECQLVGSSGPIDLMSNIDPQGQGNILDSHYSNVQGCPQQQGYTQQQQFNVQQQP